MSANNSPGPTVSPSAVVAAGLASTGAATITSVFNVAGTLIGAALTAMIITGGSAVLRAYLESASSKVRSAPGKVRERTARNGRRKDALREEFPENRQSFGERVLSAFRWFSHLSAFRQSAILRRALAGGAVAAVLGIGLITAIELGLGNNLSCSIWNECGTSTSVTGTADASANTRPSLLGGGRQAATYDGTDQQVTPGQETPSGVDQGSPLPGGSEQPQQPSPGDSGTPTPGSGTPTPGSGTPTPGSGTPTPGSGSQDPGGGTPSQPADPSQQPANGSGGSGTPGSGAEQPAGGAGGSGAGGAEGGSQ